MVATLFWAVHLLEFTKLKEQPNSLASQRGFLFAKSDLCNGILWDCLQEVERKERVIMKRKLKRTRLCLVLVARLGMGIQVHDQ